MPDHYSGLATDPSLPSERQDASDRTAGEQAVAAARQLLSQSGYEPTGSEAQAFHAKFDVYRDDQD